MANPQPDQYTRLSNELLEALARIRISGEENQVLLVIVRQTYGYHKKEDDISLSQFVFKTGLKKPNVCRALSKLITKNMIIKKDNGSIASYGIQKDYSLWRPLSKKITLSKPITPIGKKDNKSLSKKIHTKEIKETITKEKKSVGKKTGPRIREFISYYQDLFKNTFGEDSYIEWGKEGKLIKGLLGAYSLERLQELLGLFFESDDEFIRQSGYTIGAFKSQVQKLAVGGKSSALPKHTKTNLTALERFKEREEKTSDQ